MRRSITALLLWILVGGVACAQPVAPYFTQTGLASNAALKAAPLTNVTAGSVVHRSGFTSAGDGGAADYVYSATACSLNAGAGDNGAQVKPTAGPGCWVAQFPQQVFDPRVWGLACGTSADQSVALSAAASYANTSGGGSVKVPCPVSVGNTITLKGSTRLTSSMPAYYPGQSFVPGPAVWPPTAGAAINCTSTTAACIMVQGEGVEIDHINFGNPQPIPVATWTPTSYPYVVATSGCTATWQGLHIHDVSFTSVTKAIDLEGCTSYSTVYSASQIVIDHVWCNVCTDVGIRQHFIDNPIRISNVEFTPSWYNNVASMGAYMRAHSVGFDDQYVAAPNYSNITFFAQKTGIRLTNDTVTNNFGNVTLAISAAVMTNIQANQVCQAITTAGNGEIATMMISNMNLWGDQSGFQCAKNLPLISLPTNDAVLTLTNVNAYALDTLLSIGCGAPGTGSCPAGAPGGGAYANINGLFVDTYDTYTAAAPMISAPASAVLNVGTSTPYGFLRASGGTGPAFGAGLDGTVFNPALLVGAGATGIGGVSLSYGDATHSGATNYWSANNTRVGFVGWNNPGGLSIVPQDVLVISPQNSIGNGMEVNLVSGKLAVSPLGSSAWPTACTGLPTGTLWNSAGTLKVC